MVNYVTHKDIHLRQARDKVIQSYKIIIETQTAIKGGNIK